MLLLILALPTVPADSAVIRDVEVASGEILRTTSAGSGQPIVLSADSVQGAGQYIQEEQPGAVAAVARLERMAR